MEQINLNEWELHIPYGRGKNVYIDKDKVKANLDKMPDEEYINPEEKLLATSTKADTSNIL